MAKEKIFSPEDFDKSIDKTWWQKYRVLILSLSGALIIAGVILFCIFFKAVDKKEVLAQQELAESPEAKTLLEDNQDENSETLDMQEHNNTDIEIENPDTKTTGVTTNQEVKHKEEETQKAVTDEKVSNNVETEAFNVIHGAYGNGEVRKSKLGERYQSIQNRVNELKRQGAF